MGAVATDPAGNATTATADFVLRAPHTYDVVIHVRDHSIAASIDGKLVAEHATNFSDLSLPADAYVGDGVLGLRVLDAVIAFDTVEIREIGGEGKLSPRQD